MPEIRFIPESHTYLVDGEPKLSVTQVLDANGMYPEFGKNAAAARFGTIGHKIVKMEIDGKLSGYDPAFEPYMEAMRYSEKDDFVGTVDFVGYAGQETILRKLILDWKFWSAPQKILLTLAGYQTAGYSRLFFGAVPVRRAVVHFYPEGYTILPLRDPLDSVAFQSLLNVAKLKLKMGIYKPKGQTDDE
jgi:hypothetical protein